MRSTLLRGLAIIYLIAFASLLPQVHGLIGSHGILPAHDYLQSLYTDYGRGAYTASILFDSRSPNRTVGFSLPDFPADVRIGSCETA